MFVWDYKIKKNWKPKTDVEWIWYLERKINYDDWTGLKTDKIIKYYKKIKIDQGKRLMLNVFLKKYHTDKK